MADEPDAPTTYRIPDEHSARRAEIIAEWIRERSTWGVELLGCAAADELAAALRVWSRLEITNEYQAQELRLAWLATVEDAYARGQQDAHRALQVLEDTHTGPVVEPIEPPPTRH